MLEEAHFQYVDFFFRLVNILQTTENHENLWKVIKEIRKDFLLKNLTRVCQDSNTLLHDYYIFENTKMIEKSLDIETDYESHGNVTKETIEAGVKMFTYLNLCPPMMMKYFEELLLKGTLKEIILSTSAIIRKSKKAVKKSAIDLFQKIGQKLGLKHRKIDLVTKRKSIFIENKNGVLWSQTRMRIEMRLRFYLVI